MELLYLGTHHQHMERFQWSVANPWTKMRCDSLRRCRKRYIFPHIKEVFYTFRRVSSCTRSPAMNRRLVQALVSAEWTQQTIMQKAIVHHLLWCAVLGFDYLTVPVFVRGDATCRRCLRVYVCLTDALLSSAAVFHISIFL